MTGEMHRKPRKARSVNLPRYLHHSKPPRSRRKPATKLDFNDSYSAPLSINNLQINIALDCSCTGIFETIEDGTFVDKRNNMTIDANYFVEDPSLIKSANVCLGSRSGLQQVLALAVSVYSAPYVKSKSNPLVQGSTDRNNSNGTSPPRLGLKLIGLREVQDEFNVSHCLKGTSISAMALLFAPHHSVLQDYTTLYQGKDNESVSNHSPEYVAVLELHTALNSVTNLRSSYVKDCSASTSLQPLESTIASTNLTVVPTPGYFNTLEFMNQLTSFSNLPTESYWLSALPVVPPSLATLVVPAVFSIPASCYDACRLGGELSQAYACHLGEQSPKVNALTWAPSMTPGTFTSNLEGLCTPRAGYSSNPSEARNSMPTGTGSTSTNISSGAQWKHIRFTSSTWGSRTSSDDRDCIVVELCAAVNAQKSMLTEALGTAGMSYVSWVPIVRKVSTPLWVHHQKSRLFQVPAETHKGDGYQVVVDKVQT